LLPETRAKMLDQIYRDGKLGVEAQMQRLLAEFPSAHTIIVLLDNFEDVVDAATQAITEGGLDEALPAAIDAPPHGVKLVLTTRVAPQALLRLQPSLQQVLKLDEGLASPHAENVLKAMDKDGSLGLREATAPLNEARIATRGYPRALEAIVGILRTDRSTTLAGLLAELRALHPTAEGVVRDLVGEAFSRLDPLAQEVMQALAIYGVPVPAVAVDYLLQPYRVGIDSARVLGRLVNMQFARGEAGHFYLHQVDRDYALSRIPEGELDDLNAAPPPFTCHALRHRAAEWFKEIRRPREEWKSLDDLLPQLTEFDLRTAGRDYDPAASVLIEIDDDYMKLWGHSRLLAERYERLDGRLTDAELEWKCVLGLGNALFQLAQYDRAVDRYQRLLDLGQAAQNRWAQSSALTGLGNCFSGLGDENKAIEFSQQALSIEQEQEDKQGIAINTANLADSHAILGRMTEAMALSEQAVSLYKEIGDRPNSCISTYNLAEHLRDAGETSRSRSVGAEACATRDMGNRSIRGHG
jgi:tetratricopeptide (TPR) repeat protein